MGNRNRGCHGITPVLPLCGEVSYGGAMTNYRELTSNEINAWYTMIEDFRYMGVEKIHVTDGSVELVAPKMDTFSAEDQEKIRGHIANYRDNGYRHPEDPEVIFGQTPDGASIAEPWILYALDAEYHLKWRDRVYSAEAKEQLARIVERIEAKNRG